MIYRKRRINGRHRLVCFACADKFTRPMIKETCTRNGKTYKVGEKVRDNPCQPCFCSEGGLMACMVIDCMMPNCADYVRNPDQCCSTCPNGPNCRLPDGTLMSADKPHVMADGSVCQCHHMIGMGFTPYSVNATCTTSLKSIVTDIPM
ncbi:hypothetical protein LOTGIDRAFT_228029 [Lottia gigantea]|uniref:VWFC domain-containing protein n=1 Tax=Lottia gigantea TaxID=225164 RepID=V4B4P0_LOTGI|nr:hypothetical protein LOTGIDRAFT_228029 [Lottia gigantea]ESP05448.1 hypothetical protein LOTGIDRAFT_228029 [Lottia gigantea]